MEADKIKKIRHFLDRGISALLNLLVSIVNLVITAFMLFGSLAAIILLYKMFPLTGLIVLKPMLVVFGILLKLFYVVLMLLLVLGIIYFYTEIEEFIQKMHKKRKNNREKFMNEVVAKLKRGAKNK